LLLLPAAHPAVVFSPSEAGAASSATVACDWQPAQWRWRCEWSPNRLAAGSPLHLLRFPSHAALNVCCGLRTWCGPCPAAVPPYTATCIWPCRYGLCWIVCCWLSATA